jgi:Holliday junction resolvase RusA-like endonuclease
MPPEHRAWMEAAVTMLREQRQGEPFAGPVAVEIVAYWPLPRARPAWCEKERWKAREASCGIPYATKPDADNVGKIVLDALVEAGILADDRFVVELSIVKRCEVDTGRVDVFVVPC